MNMPYRTTQVKMQSGRSADRTAGRPRRNPRRRADEVLTAAAAVFAQRGYHGATTQEIADFLNIRQASLYYYVASKEDALELVCQRGVEGFIEQATSAARIDAGACERLSQVVTSHVQASADKRDFTIVFLNERQHLSDPARGRIGRLASRYETIIQTIFEAGVTNGELREDLDCRLATLMLLAMCNSVLLWGRKQCRFDIDVTAGHISRLLCHGVAAAPSVDVEQRA